MCSWIEARDEEHADLGAGVAEEDLLLNPQRAREGEKLGLLLAVQALGARGVLQEDEKVEVAGGQLLDAAAVDLVIAGADGQVLADDRGRQGRLKLAKLLGGKVAVGRIGAGRKNGVLAELATEAGGVVAAGRDVEAEDHREGADRHRADNLPQPGQAVEPLLGEGRARGRAASRLRATEGEHVEGHDRAVEGLPRGVDRPGGEVVSLARLVEPPEHVGRGHDEVPVHHAAGEARPGEAARPIVGRQEENAMRSVSQSHRLNHPVPVTAGRPQARVIALLALNPRGKGPPLGHSRRLKPATTALRQVGGNEASWFCDAIRQPWKTNSNQAPNLSIRPTKLRSKVIASAPAIWPTPPAAAARSP